MSKEIPSTDPNIDQWAEAELIERYGEKIGIYNLVFTLFSNEHKRECDTAILITMQRIKFEGETVELNGEKVSDLAEGTQRALKEELEKIFKDKTDVERWIRKQGFDLEVKADIWGRIKNYYHDSKAADPNLQQMTISDRQMREAHERAFSGEDPRYKPYSVIRKGLNVAVFESYLQHYLRSHSPSSSVQ